MNNEWQLADRMMSYWSFLLVAMGTNLPDNIDDSDIARVVSGLKSKALDNAPATVKVTSGGTIVGAAVLGPAGGVLGAVAGSGVGYLIDEGYLDGFEEEPEELEVEAEFDD